MNTYGDPTREDIFVEGTEISNGNLLLVGRAADATGQTDGWIIKTDDQGNVIWSYLHGNPARDEIFNSAVEAPDGSIYVAGTQTQNSNREFITVVRLSASGQLIWEKMFGGVSTSDFDDQSRKILFHEGALFLFGSSKNNGILAGENGYILSLDTLGNTRFSHAHGSQGRDQIRDAIIAQNGNFIGTGFVDLAERGTTDFLIFEADTTGHILWSKSYGTTNQSEYGQRIVELSDGSLVAVGYQDAAGGGEAMLIRTTRQGQLIWSKTFGGGGDDQGQGVVEFSNGNILFMGQSSSFSTNGDQDILMIEVDINGQLQNTFVYGGGDEDLIRHTEMLADGAFLATGWSRSAPFAKLGDRNAVALKLGLRNESKNLCFRRSLNNQVSNRTLALDTDSVMLSLPSFLSQQDIFNHKVHQFFDSTLCSWTTSIESYTENELELYPNPTSKILHINFPSSMVRPFRYNIFDMQGRQIPADIFSESTTKFELKVDELPSGFYFFKLIDKEGKYWQRKWIKD